VPPPRPRGILSGRARTGRDPDLATEQASVSWAATNEPRPAVPRRDGTDQLSCPSCGLRCANLRFGCRRQASSPNWWITVETVRRLLLATILDPLSPPMRPHAPWDPGRLPQATPRLEEMVRRVRHATRDGGRRAGTSQAPPNARPSAPGCCADSEAGRERRASSRDFVRPDAGRSRLTSAVLLDGSGRPS